MGEGKSLLPHCLTLVPKANLHFDSAPHIPTLISKQELKQSCVLFCKFGEVLSSVLLVSPAIYFMDSL